MVSAMPAVAKVALMPAMGRPEADFLAFATRLAVAALQPMVCVLQRGTRRPACHGDLRGMAHPSFPKGEAFYPFG